MIRTAQMLAHDIRRPFSIIDTTVKGLQSEGDPNRIKRLLSKLAPDLERAKESVEVMIGDILEIERASKPRMTPRAPGEVLADSLRDSIIRLQPADVTIKSLFEHTLRINIDEPKIRRTFCNII
jgi:signal transduction histidine kinase